MARSGVRDVGVQRVGQLHDGLFAQFALVAFHGQLGAAVDDGGGVAGEFVLVEQFAHFHLDQLEQLGVVDHVALVQEDDDVGHADLARQQDVLARLRHGAVGGGHDQDGAVHLRRTGDHVLDVVGVPGAVDVRVVALGGFVFDVRGVDGDAAGLFFRRRVDLVVGLGLAAELGRQHRGDRRRQRGLAMVHVPNRAHVHVRLGAFEFTFCHLRLLLKSTIHDNACEMVPMARIERATSPLPRECSTTEPHGHRHGPGHRRYPGLWRPAPSLEREAGIEPASLAWKAKVLPLNYSRPARLARLAPRPLTLLKHGLAIHFSPGGGGWIRTSVGVSQQIYSLPPLATRAPLRGEPATISPFDVDSALVAA